ncbi:MAG: YebC/PmpR family DNA-binding transcriptional regulator [Armatimonadetes bacterium]|nr:YebC/PmpR family DNA-binding transcriptional regulator [Armatimonadota bacterium]
MSGHSKWANIRIRKGKQDAKRGKLFTKLSKEILIAGKGGPDPESNFRLKVAIQKAKENNVPSTNIERLLDKIRGGGQESYDEITYEGYGPHGVAVLVEAATDNRNRTAAQIRTIFSRHGGNLGEGGCVAWLFDKRGFILVEDESLDEEALLMAAMEAGALDMEADGGTFSIYTEPTELHQVKDALESAGIQPREVQFTMLPKNTVACDREAASSVMQLLEILEEHDDVQNVYANADIPDEVLEELEAGVA